MTLPDICKHGQTAFERKMLLYFHVKSTMKFELRYPDSTLYELTDLPPLQGLVELIPMWEIGKRIFLFENRVDQQKSLEHLANVVKTSTRVRKRRNRRPRKKDVPGNNRNRRKKSRGT